MIKIKNDKYKKTRGGVSRIYDIACEHCHSHVAYYQKDGSGTLKRMYVDRFIDKHPDDDKLICNECGRVLGIKIIYEKENRSAYRLFVGSIKKKITSINKIGK